MGRRKRPRATGRGGLRCEVPSSGARAVTGRRRKPKKRSFQNPSEGGWIWKREWSWRGLRGRPLSIHTLLAVKNHRLYHSVHGTSRGPIVQRHVRGSAKGTTDLAAAVGRYLLCILAAKEASSRHSPLSPANEGWRRALAEKQLLSNVTWRLNRLISARWKQISFVPVNGT